jgi:hypothetical protein
METTLGILNIVARRSGPRRREAEGKHDSAGLRPDGSPMPPLFSRPNRAFIP